MNKILEFLKCKNIDEVTLRIKSVEINEELEEFKNLMTAITKGSILKTDVTKLSGKTELLKYLRGDIGLKNTEEFKLICLDSRNQVILEETLFKGTVNRSAIYPRLIIEKVLKVPTRGVIFAHNHPSKKIEPSSQDISITAELNDLLDRIDVKVLDHIIVSDTDTYYSFYENGLLDNHF